MSACLKIQMTRKWLEFRVDQSKEGLVAISTWITLKEATGKDMRKGIAAIAAT